MATGPLQLFKGTRVVFYKNLIKDYLTVRIYLPLQRAISGLQTFQNFENESARFFWSSLVASHVSSFMFPFLLVPFDVVKTKVMCDVASPKKATYNKFYSTVQKIRSTEGNRAIFKGVGFSQLSCFLQSVYLLTGNHLIFSSDENKIKGLVTLNAVGSIFLYPLDTIMLLY